MTAHDLHSDPRDEVLVDGCPRCTEHAEHPLASLDPDHVGLLWQEMIAVEKTGTLDRYRSILDAQACRQLYQIACWVERTMPALDPWQWPWGIRPYLPLPGTADESPGREPPAEPDP